MVFLLKINEMKNAKSNLSKQKSLEKLFKALNREGEISSKNTGELRKWILSAKPFNSPQKDEILDELKQILRVKVSKIESGRDLKILNQNKIMAHNSSLFSNDNISISR